MLQRPYHMPPDQLQNPNIHGPRWRTCVRLQAGPLEGSGTSLQSSNFLAARRSKSHWGSHGSWDACNFPLSFSILLNQLKGTFILDSPPPQHVFWYKLGLQMMGCAVFQSGGGAQRSRLRFFWWHRAWLCAACGCPTSCPRTRRLARCWSGQ